jgi:hypothetical protein
MSASGTLEFQGFSTVSSNSAWIELVSSGFIRNDINFHVTEREGDSARVVLLVESPRTNNSFPFAFTRAKFSKCLLRNRKSKQQFGESSMRRTRRSPSSTGFGRAAAIQTRLSFPTTLGTSFLVGMRSRPSLRVGSGSLTGVEVYLRAP